MERSTVDIYEDRGDQWANGSALTPRRDAAEDLGGLIGDGRPRIDVGCGAGRYTKFLGSPCIGVDAARSMLQMCTEAVPYAPLVQADIEALPFGEQTLAGAWANMSYLHVPKIRLPAALADLHRILGVGAPFDLQVLKGDFEGTDLPDDQIGGRFFAAWFPDRLAAVLTGAGFEVLSSETAPGGGATEVVRMRAIRQRTLPDTVGPEMRLLVCGLNPSVYSADAGMSFARPGNRFWPAALASGLVTEARDTHRALAVDRIGMTDIVKRATSNASQLSPAEYRSGVRRVEDLVDWLEPRAVLFVGLAGWRAAIDPKATAGVQPLEFGGRPAYVMPSTSGINANSRLDDLTEHMRAALELADRSR
jgi:TDG/mug DNA glycosylase family protein